MITLDSYKHTFGGKVEAIASKSFAHRLLIAAALSDTESEVICNTTSKDIEATIACLNSMGASIRWDKNVLKVRPIPRGTKNSTYNKAEHSADQKAEEEICRIDCGESGSTLRFLLPILGILGLSTEITMHGRLSERPLSPLYEEMERHGVSLSPQKTNPLLISGAMSGGDYVIAGNISSQYITGLLFALPNASVDSRICITGTLQSRPYVDITLSVLREFGIKIEENVPGEDSEYSVIFNVPGNQVYHPVKTYVVEGDWSNAAFFLTAGAINKAPVTVTGLRMDSLQGDRRILSLLQEFGADAKLLSREDGLTDISVSEGESGLHGIEIDASDIPDLVPILSVAAAFAEGTTRIRNIERLRIKESDRVVTVIETISGLGGTIREEDGCIVIEGQKMIAGGTIDSANDHRIAMTAAIASIRCRGAVSITNPMAVEKSYPQFYDELNKLILE